MQNFPVGKELMTGPPFYMFVCFHEKLEFKNRQIHLFAKFNDKHCVSHSIICILCSWSCRWAMAEGYGACMINKSELLKDMVQQTRARVNNPDFTVSVKIRIHDNLR